MNTGDMSKVNLQERQDAFQVWLMEFDRFLADWMDGLPEDLPAKLDYSPASLAALGDWSMDRWADVPAVRADQDGWNAASIYLGETIRKTLGGRWELCIHDPKNVFFALPTLIRDTNPAPVCPSTLISASVDRRDPRMLKTLLERWSARVDGVPSRADGIPR